MAGSYSTPGVESQETKEPHFWHGPGGMRAAPDDFVFLSFRCTLALAQSAADSEDGPALPPLQLPKVTEHEGNMSERRSCSVCGMAATYHPTRQTIACIGLNGR